jgi:hypothetical protein
LLAPKAKEGLAVGLAVSAGLPKLKEGAELAPAAAFAGDAPKLNVEDTGRAGLSGAGEPNRLPPAVAFAVLSCDELAVGAAGAPNENKFFVVPDVAVALVDSELRVALFGPGPTDAKGLPVGRDALATGRAFETAALAGVLEKLNNPVFGGATLNEKTGLEFVLDYRDRSFAYPWGSAGAAKAGFSATA